MTQPVSDSDAAEFAEVLRRFFFIRSQNKLVLPEMIAALKSRLDKTYPGGKNNRVLLDYNLLRRVAHFLSDQEEPASMGELSRALDLPLSTTTRIVDWLERSSFVERLPDPGDRRVVRVGLTDEGRAAQRVMEDVIHRRVEAWLERFPPEERRPLIHLLGKLVDIIEETGTR